MEALLLLINTGIFFLIVNWAFANDTLSRDKIERGLFAMKKEQPPSVLPKPYIES